MRLFKDAYEGFIKYHMENRRGDRLFQLKRDHGEAKKLFLQKIWWPAFGHFQDLQPEYQVYDFRDGKRYLDFAFIRPPMQICIEIDGFGPHWQNMNRRKFADDRMRQNHLEIDGWMVIRFAYDDVLEHPRLCQQVVQQMIGRWSGDFGISGIELNYIEKEIIRLAIRSGMILPFQAVHAHLGISEKSARKMLRTLVDKGILRPASGTQRVHAYELIPERINRFL